MKILSPISSGAVPWLQTGYSLFAADGPDGIQVERLARVMVRNKSGFYHFFGERDTYFDYLARYHMEQLNDFITDVKAVDSFDPGFIESIADHPTNMLFNMQLVRNRHLSFCADVLAEVHKRIDSYVLPIWTAFFELEQNPIAAKQFYEIMCDIYSVRMNARNFNVDILRKIAVESKNTIQELMHTRRPDDLSVPMVA
jgi:AcrR family transcriptional regulator